MQSKVAERLVIHARLCRQMAASSRDETMASKLLEMAEECMQAAAADIVIDNMKAARTH